jgi:dienelactone hydrolase
MAWLRREHEAPSGFLHGALDLNKLAVAGHSRGGKLAALLYAGKGIAGSVVAYGATAALVMSSRKVVMLLSHMMSNQRWCGNAERPEVKAALLVDPVDNTSEQYSNFGMSAKRQLGIGCSL